MKIGIIGPSNLEYLNDVNPHYEEILTKLAGILVEKGQEIVVTPDKNSVSEFFAKIYLENGGKKVYSIIPLEDKEFGFDWVNQGIGEKVNCFNWRNQPEKFNEETDLLICVGYAVGGMIEVGYSKWFKPKTVYVIKDLVSSELPRELNRSLKIEYISYRELSEKLENGQ